MSDCNTRQQDWWTFSKTKGQNIKSWMFYSPVSAVKIFIENLPHFAAFFHTDMIPFYQQWMCFWIDQQTNQKITKNILAIYVKEFGRLNSKWKHQISRCYKIFDEKKQLEMFYLNTIEQLFLFVEQLDQLGVPSPLKLRSECNFRRLWGGGGWKGLKPKLLLGFTK